MDSEKLVTQKQRNADRDRRRVFPFSTAVIALCSLEGLGGSNCDVDTHTFTFQSVIRSEVTADSPTLQPTVIKTLSDMHLVT